MMYKDIYGGMDSLYLIFNIRKKYKEIKRYVFYIFFSFDEF